MVIVFLIHGAYGNPEENWFPWLKNELEKDSVKVIVPAFPTPKEQSLDNWNRIFEEYNHYNDEEILFVGHSLGSAFILSLLEQVKSPVKAAFFVSGFIKPLGNKTFDHINKTFIDKRFDWKKIQDNCEQFFIYHSNNDPYVPIEYSRELGDNLGVEIKIVKNAGHFNKKSGYDTFEKLLEDIKRIL